MAQARRRNAGRTSRGGSHGYGMFAAGVVVGAVAASFVIGMRSDDPESIGRGIEHLIEASRNRDAPRQAEPAPPEQPRISTEFRYYEVLPGIENVVPVVPEPAAPGPDETADAPSGEVSPQPAAVPDATPEPAAGGRESHYMLQAGAFNRADDAETLKARLALEGLESTIQKVTIEGRGDFYRVRLGPFVDLDRLRQVDRRLGTMGIDALRLKVSAG